MNNRSSALLPPVISVAVIASMLSLGPLFTAPVFSSSLLLAVGLPGLIATAAALLRLRRSSVILAALSGTVVLSSSDLQHNCSGQSRQYHGGTPQTKQGGCGGDQAGESDREEQ